MKTVSHCILRTVQCKLLNPLWKCNKMQSWLCSEIVRNLSLEFRAVLVVQSDARTCGCHQQTTGDCSSLGASDWPASSGCQATPTGDLYAAWCLRAVRLSGMSFVPSGGGDVGGQCGQADGWRAVGCPVSSRPVVFYIANGFARWFACDALRYTTMVYARWEALGRETWVQDPGRAPTRDWGCFTRRRTVPPVAAVRSDGRIDPVARLSTRPLPRTRPDYCISRSCPNRPFPPPSHRRLPAWPDVVCACLMWWVASRWRHRKWISSRPVARS